MSFEEICFRKNRSFFDLKKQSCDRRESRDVCVYERVYEGVCVCVCMYVCVCVCV